MPLIIRVPWASSSARGKKTKVKAELIDIYKTLVGLAVPALSTKIEPDVQGTSLAPLFSASEQDFRQLVDKKAYSQIGSCACQVYSVAAAADGSHPAWNGKECGAGRCIRTPLNQFDYMGCAAYNYAALFISRRL